MKKSGRIELYDQDGSLVDSFKYKWPKHRRDIIEIWKARYVEALNKCYFIIRPIVDISKVKTTGENYGIRRPTGRIRVSRKIEKPKKRTP